MADFLALKGPSETVVRRWTAPVDSDDGAASVSASATGVTLSAYELQGNDVVLTISGGSAAATGTITVTVTTSRSRTLIEKLYIPVCDPASTAQAVSSIIDFALRKVAGLGVTAETSQTNDALERLKDMLEQWRASGADVGATRALTTSTVLYAPESYLSAIKNNLILQLADIYGAEVSPVVIENARRGLAHIKQANLSDVRAGVYY